MPMQFIASSNLPTAFGLFTISVFKDLETNEEHVMLSKGLTVDAQTVPDKDTPVLIRLHSECLTGDAFGSLKCECGPQLHHTMALIETAGTGAILYLRQEGRGIGLANKIRAYALQDQGHDTVNANLLLGLPEDARTYTMCRVMLEHFNIRRVKVLTNNPAKIEALTALGIEITERVPLHVGENPLNQEYLNTKQTKMRHIKK